MTRMPIERAKVLMEVLGDHFARAHAERLQSRRDFVMLSAEFIPALRDRATPSEQRSIRVWYYPNAQ